MFFTKRTGLKLLTYYFAHKKDAIWRGAVAGAIGGLVGSGLMKVGEVALSSTMQNGKDQKLRGVTAEDPTVKVATVISEKVMKSELSPNGKKAGGALVHYLFGASVGAAYGAVSELVPTARIGAGAPFGATVWAAADLASVPAFGLSKPPNQIPLSKHAQVLGMRVAYGLATETVRHYVREALD